MKRSYVALPSTFAALLAQAMVASLLAMVMSYPFGGPGFGHYVSHFEKGIRFYGIIYVPQFLLVFLPIAYLLHKPEQHKLLCSVLAGVAASMIGIPLNNILFTPFATTDASFHANNVIESYNRLSVDIIAGAAAQHRDLAIGCVPSS